MHVAPPTARRHGRSTHHRQLSAQGTCLENVLGEENVSRERVHQHQTPWMRHVCRDAAFRSTELPVSPADLPISPLRVRAAEAVERRQPVLPLHHAGALLRCQPSDSPLVGALPLPCQGHVGAFDLRRLLHQPAGRSHHVTKEATSCHKGGHIMSSACHTFTSQQVLIRNILEEDDRRSRKLSEIKGEAV